MKTQTVLNDHSKIVLKLNGQSTVISICEVAQREMPQKTMYRWDENIKIEYAMSINSDNLQEQYMYIDIKHTIGSTERSLDFGCIVHVDSINEIILHSADAHKVQTNYNAF